MLTDEMSRHTTLRFCLDPTVEQHKMLARHAGAARFAFNQRLAMVKTALTQRKTNPGIEVPWSGFDLINVFNGWKKAEDAGRVLAIDSTSFRLRNKHPKGAPAAIRVGDNDRPRSITLPGIGQIGVHDDTRRLRRMLARDRAKILFATVSHHAGCWWVSLTLRPPICTPPTSIRRAIRETLAGVGLDRGLSAFVVAADADGREVDRITAAPKALTAGMKRQRRLAKSLSRKQKESRNRRDAAAKLGRHHHHIANIRRYFLHQVSNELVKTHDRLVIETLNVSGMLANHRLARAISDAGWAEFARQLSYKQDWRGGELVLAGRWYPSSKLRPACGAIRGDLTLADRMFTCVCGHSADRDLNAAANLARWAEKHHLDPRTPKQRGRATNARRRDCADQHPKRAGETSPVETGTDVHAAPAA
jgi:putative transposase